MNLPDGEYPIDLSTLRKNNVHKILQLKFSSNTNNGSALDRIDSTKFEIIGNRSTKNYYIYSDGSGDSRESSQENKDLLMEVSNLKSKDSEFILVLDKENQLSLVKLSNIIRINKSRISKKTQTEIMKYRNDLNNNKIDTMSSRPVSRKAVVSSRKQSAASESAMSKIRKKVRQSLEPRILKKEDSDKSVIEKNDPWSKVPVKSSAKEKRIKGKTANNMEASLTPTAVKNEVELFDDDFNFDNFDQFDDDLSKTNDVKDDDTINESNKKSDDFVEEKIQKNQGKKDEKNMIASTKKASKPTNNAPKEDSAMSDVDLSFEDELEEELNEVLGNEYDDGQGDDDDIDMELHLDNDDSKEMSDDEDFEDLEGLEVVDDPFAQKPKSKTTEVTKSSTTTKNSDARSSGSRKTAGKRTPTAYTTSKSSVVQANSKSSKPSGTEELSDIDLSLEEEQDDEDLDNIDLDEEEISSEEE